MSIIADENTRVVILGGPAGVTAARRMAEFSYLIKQPVCVKAFVFPPDAGKTAEIPYGSDTQTIPIFASVAEATKTFRDGRLPRRTLRSRMKSARTAHAS